MSSNVPCGNISLDSLSYGIPTIPPRSAGFFIENSMVCFDSQGHSSGVIIVVKTDDNEDCFRVTWVGEVTEQLYKAYGNDERRTTDNGAVAMALLLVRELTDYTVVEQAGLGTTIDYFLSTKQTDDTLIFNDTEAYLEVRGIRKETKGNTIVGAVRRKVKRLKTPEDLPSYIVVVEFSKPFSRMTCHE